MVTLLHLRLLCRNDKAPQTQFNRPAWISIAKNDCCASALRLTNVKANCCKDIESVTQAITLNLQNRMHKQNSKPTASSKRHGWNGRTDFYKQLAQYSTPSPHLRLIDAWQMDQWIDVQKRNKKKKKTSFNVHSNRLMLPYSKNKNREIAVHTLQSFQSFKMFHNTKVFSIEATEWGNPSKSYHALVTRP